MYGNIYSRVCVAINVAREELGNDRGARTAGEIIRAIAIEAQSVNYEYTTSIQQHRGIMQDVSTSRQNQSRSCTYLTHIDTPALADPRTSVWRITNKLYGFGRNTWTDRKTLKVPAIWHRFTFDIYRRGHPRSLSLSLEARVCQSSSSTVSRWRDLLAESGFLLVSQGHTG